MRSKGFTTQPYPKKFEDRPPSLSFEDEVEED